MQISKGDPSYPQKTKLVLPLKPTKIDRKAIKKVNPKGQRRGKGLELVRDAKYTLEDGKQKHEWEGSCRERELRSHTVLSCSLVKALMSFENRQKANNNKNKNLDKGIQFTCEPLDRLRSGIPWLRGEGGLK